MYGTLSHTKQLYALLPTEDTVSREKTHAADTLKQSNT